MGGPESEDALKVLQGTMGLEETGIVGSQDELEKILSFEHEPFSAAEIAKSRIVENLFIDPELTAGAEKTDDGYVFATEVEGNAFSKICWQLLDSDQNHLEYFDSQTEGNHEGSYLFNYDTGSYYIKLKAYGNKVDEELTKKIELINNTFYYYTYSIDMLESQIAVISKVSFGREQK